MPTSRTETKVTKLDQVLQATRARHGVALSALMEVTGWQSHSVRAALSRLRKRGHNIEYRRDKRGLGKYRLCTKS
jgi:DNA-binding transcriptional regulator PaaX